ncbi:hypothetical protein J27TS8_19900 [Robertmurraya siralis]|uniref:Lipid II:glycine glycyltransferase n=1 Tax=Robertmurraya siralis TaxID=77777 RepID=A0A919WHU2_9BACI|nr:peptidoglycan bridge formation glycyltransferase FemA/FemB family protein [Robertmurraya siralis]GIN61997.1 hypothetical protein J27TS8_19900 [Robertmurraya siralis]
MSANSSLLEQLHLLRSADDWSPFLARFSNLDVYYTKEYAELFAVIQNGTPNAIYFENENGKVFYSFIKRGIDGTGELYFDLITPYGYGGPLVEGDPTIIRSFYSLFTEYCLKQNIVSETVTLHPLLKNHEYIKEVMKTDYVRKTTAVDLSLSLDEIRSQYSKNAKRNIRKAVKNEVTISVANSKEEIDQFTNMYYETMDRHKASKFYYFDRSYFHKQLMDTNLSKSVLLLAWSHSEMIAGVLLLIGNQFAHYHLGASRAEFLSLRPNHLLFDAMIEYAKMCHSKFLHLGGGYLDEDELYRFKTSFTNKASFDYYLGKHIINEKKYSELTKPAIKSSEKSYFPAYRMGQND